MEPDAVDDRLSIMPTAIEPTSLHAPRDWHVPPSAVLRGRNSSIGRPLSVNSIVYPNYAGLDLKTSNRFLETSISNLFLRHTSSLRFPAPNVCSQLVRPPHINRQGPYRCSVGAAKWRFARYMLELKSASRPLQYCASLCGSWPRKTPARPTVHVFPAPGNLTVLSNFRIVSMPNFVQIPIETSAGNIHT